MAAATGSGGGDTAPATPDSATADGAANPTTPNRPAAKRGKTGGGVAQSNALTQGTPDRN